MTPPLPIPAPTPVPPPDLPWLEIITASSAVVAAIVGGFAALAAWRSANAAKATAGQVDETARRAIEALSRALRPERLDVGVWSGNAEWNDRTVPEQWPGPLRVQVWNRGTVTAVDVRATLTDANGRVWPELRPATLPRDTPHVWHLADFVPTCDAADRAVPGSETRTARHQLVVTFSDARDLLRWRQTFTVVESPILSDDVRPPIPQRIFRVKADGLPELADRSR